jgi:hypothetical protein
MVFIQAFLSEGSQLQAGKGDPIVFQLYGIYNSLEDATIAGKEMADNATEAEERGEETASLPFLLMDLGPYHALSSDASYSQETIQVGERMQDTVARQMASEPTHSMAPTPTPEKPKPKSKSTLEEKLIPTEGKQARTEKQVETERTRIDRLLHVDSEETIDTFIRDMYSDWNDAEDEHDRMDAFSRIIDRYALAREKIGMARHKKEEAIPRRENSMRAIHDWKERVHTAISCHPDWNAEWVDRYVDALATSGITLSDADPNSIVPFLYESDWGETKIDIEGLVKKRRSAQAMAPDKWNKSDEGSGNLFFYPQ